MSSSGSTDFDVVVLSGAIVTAVAALMYPSPSVACGDWRSMRVVSSHRRYVAAATGCSQHPDP